MSRSSDRTVACNPLKPGSFTRPHSNGERGSGTDSADLSLQVIILRRVPLITTSVPGAKVSFTTKIKDREREREKLSIVLKNAGT